MRKFVIPLAIFVVCMSGWGIYWGLNYDLVPKQTTEQQFKELTIEGRGRFILYTGPGQLIWVSKEEKKK